MKTINVVEAVTALVFETQVNNALSHGQVLLSTHVMPVGNYLRYIAVMGKVEDQQKESWSETLARVGMNHPVI